jgi:hypothetical protein
MACRFRVPVRSSWFFVSMCALQTDGQVVESELVRSWDEPDHGPSVSLMSRPTAIDDQLPVSPALRATW